MKSFTVGIADGVQMIHDIFDNVSKIYKDKINHFYSITEVKNFLFSNPLGLDILFLEVVFKDGTSGIEALSDIRSCAHNLPICLITATNIPIEVLVEICEKYNVEIINKPIEEIEIITKILSTKKNCENMYEN